MYMLFLKSMSISWYHSCAKEPHWPRMARNTCPPSLQEREIVFLQPLHASTATLRKELKKGGLGGVDNTKAKAEKSRVYEKCQKLFGVHLVPCVSTVLQVGSYLLHHEPFGKPHCDGLIVRADGTHALHTSEGSARCHRQLSSRRGTQHWISGAWSLSN